MRIEALAPSALPYLRAVQERVVETASALRHPALATPQTLDGAWSYRDLPPPERAVALPLPLAADVGITLCDLLVHLHAAGVYGLSAAPRNLRLLHAPNTPKRATRAPRVLALAPPFALKQPEHLWSPPKALSPAQQDLWSVATAVLDLFDEKENVRGVGVFRVATPAWRHELHDLTREVRSPEQRLVVETIQRWGLALRREDETALAEVPTTPHALGALLARMCSPGGTERLAAMAPYAPKTPLRPTWERLVALCETMPSPYRRPEPQYLQLPLAEALHGRACEALARGDLDAAESDLDRALGLDAFVAFAATRALVYGARGELSRAVSLLEPMVSVAPRVGARSFFREDLSPPAEELARGCYVLGRALQDLGEPERAREHLERAHALHPSALYADAIARNAEGARGAVPWAL